MDYYFDMSINIANLFKYLTLKLKNYEIRT